MKKMYVWLLMSCFAAIAGAYGDDDRTLFDQMAKYLAAGDAEALSDYFSSTVEFDLLSDEGMYSKAQATLVLKWFFEKYPPKSFAFKHSSDKQTVKYAIGILHTQAGEILRVTVFIKEDNGIKIQQLRIEKN
ncbi:MAG: DUF4783 domain-containing protein [Prevotellaceae bacterium]|jgi:hypothetical protein|nr:DUF4783 domain-containing protein [Prevotellaceae bacterium]